MVSERKPPNSTSLPPSAGVGEVTTPGDLAKLLKTLRTTAGLSLDAVERHVEHLRKTKPYLVPLPRTTVSDFCGAKSIPGPETLRTFLWVCGVPEAEHNEWLAARDRAAAKGRRPDGAVRVREADPRRLGVHACIQVEAGVTGLPKYVSRDQDAQLRAHVKTAELRGGLVLVNGRSSVGKTRMLFEAVKAELPDWWLLHPDDAAAVHAFADNPTSRTVLWLDDLQNYLHQAGGLPVGTVRGLLAAGVVVVGTLWPDEYLTHTALRRSGEDDKYGYRKLLDLASVVDLVTFSPAERRRAEDLDDPRIRIALSTCTSEIGMTEVLAAGPELVRRWENAPESDCYGKAVLTAALDARRVGAQAPLTAEFLIAAAPAYLSSRQQATAPADWWKQALQYAEKPVHGAAACLEPAAAEMGKTAGYLAADYLHQHALHVRRTEQLPDSVWRALVDNHHPDDAGTLADNARRRGHPDTAEALYRHAVSAGDEWATSAFGEFLADQGRYDEAMAAYRDRAGAGPFTDETADLLTAQGRIDEAIALYREGADAGDLHDVSRLANLLLAQGRIDETITMLRRHAHGKWTLAHQLAYLLADQGRIDELRRRAETGDRFAMAPLADLLARRGSVDELRRRADDGDSTAADRLADLLAAQGRIDEAITLLRQHADEECFSDRLVDLLVGQGRVDEAITLLRQYADNRFALFRFALFRLADLLAGQGHVDEAISLLRQYVNDAPDDDGGGANRLADLLAGHDRLDEAITLLREHADAGHWQAATGLVDLLTKHGQLDELEKEAAAGIPGAVERLAELDDGQRLATGTGT